MKKIKNPFTGLEGYNCFGCSPDNPIGLKLHFEDDGEYVKTTWLPGDDYQGYNNVLHGGIQSTLMDELASWFVYARMQTAGVTSKMEIRFKKPVYTNQGAVSLRARLVETKRNLADIEVDLFDNQGKLCATGIVQYFTFSDKVAREKFWYPGPEAFYDGEE